VFALKHFMLEPERVMKASLQLKTGSMHLQNAITSRSSFSFLAFCFSFLVFGENFLASFLRTLMRYYAYAPPFSSVNKIVKAASRLYEVDSKAHNRKRQGTRC